MNHLKLGCPSLKVPQAPTVRLLLWPPLRTGLQLAVCPSPRSRLGACWGGVGRGAGRGVPSTAPGQRQAGEKRRAGPRRGGRALGFPTDVLVPAVQPLCGPHSPFILSQSLTQQRKFQFSLAFHVSASRKIAIVGFVAELSALDD